MEGGTGPNATGCRAWQRETAVVRASLAMTVVGRCGGAPWVAKLTKNNSTSTTRMREMMMMMENNNKIMSIKKTTTPPFSMYAPLSPRLMIRPAMSALRQC